MNTHHVAPIRDGIDGDQLLASLIHQYADQLNATMADAEAAGLVVDAWADGGHGEPTVIRVSVARFYITEETPRPQIKVARQVEGSEEERGASVPATELKH